MAGSDDFFGTQLIALNPWQGGGGGFEEGGSSGGGWTTPSPTSPGTSTNPNLSPLANWYMSGGSQQGMRQPLAPTPTLNTDREWDPSDDYVNVGGAWVPKQPGDPTTANPNPGSPYRPGNPNIDPIQRRPPPESTNNAGDPDYGGAASGEYSVAPTGFEYPADLAGLRGALGSWLQGNFASTPPAYGGSLNTPMSGFLGQGAGIADRSADNLQTVFSRALTSGNNVLSRYGDILNRQMGVGGQTGSLTNELMRTGGLPDMSAAMDAIRSRGLMDIEDQMAQIKEQYGQWGLGRSSDITEALTRGASRGIADINQQQSTLMSQMMSQAQDRRLGAGQLSLSADATRMNNFPALLQGMLQATQQPLQTAAGAASSMTGAGQAIIGAGAADTQRLMQNTVLPWQEFQRNTSLPYLNSAVGYATGFPPQQPVIQEGGGGGGGGWGNVAAAAISVLPFLFSSREFKEDIIPMDDSVLRRLKNLNFYKWKYKGDAVKHMGPMAEEFRDAFGVGDGKTIHFADLFGVLLGGMKELAHA